MIHHHQRPPSVSLLQMLGTNAVVAATAYGMVFGLFSLLPLSAAAVTLPINFFIFAFFFERLSGWQYFVVANGLFLVTLGTLMLAILLFGRSYFQYMLG